MLQALSKAKYTIKRIKFYFHPSLSSLILDICDLQARVSVLGMHESAHRLPGPPLRSFSDDNAEVQQRHLPVRGRSSPLSTVPRPPLPGPDSRHRDQPQLRRGRGPAPSRAGPGTQSHQKAVPGDLRSEGRGADSHLPPAAVPRAEHSPPADKLSAPSEPWPGRLHLQRAPEIRPRTLIALLAARARPEGRGQPSARSAAAAASRYQRVSLLRHRGPDAILGGRRSHLTTPPSAAAAARGFPPSEEGTAAFEG